MKNLTVVDQKRETDELRNDRTPSRPRFYWLTRARGSLLVDLDKQLLINVGSFFKRSSHFSYLVYPSHGTSDTMPGEVTGLIVSAVYFYVFE